MKVLITGGDGFIGSHLVEQLLSENTSPQDIRLLIQKGNSLQNLPNKRFDIIRGDIRDKMLLKRVTQGIDTVFHLAALTTFQAKNYEEFKEVNVIGTQNLLDACIGKHIQKFVFYSTIAVYGLPAWVGNIMNWDENRPINYSDDYGKSKWEAEKRIMHAYDKWNIPYAIIRPTSVYGPREKGQLYELYKAIKNHYFFMIGSGENKMHFVYVKDLVKGTLQAQRAKKKASHYILGGKEPIAFRDIVKSVARSINTNVPRFSIPNEIALPASYILDAAGKFIGVRSPLFPSRVRVLTRSYFYSINKAEKEISYNPQTKFEEGTKITGKWYLENGYL